MRTLEDINELFESHYGLQATMRTFAYRNSTSFFQAEREWSSVLETCDRIIREKHRLDPSNQSLPISETPVIHAFRQTYQAVLTKMPENIVDCQQSLDDMHKTLAAVKSLNDVTPFEDQHSITSLVVPRLRDGPIEERHIPEVECLGAYTAKTWSERRAKQSKPQRPMVGWDQKTYEQTLLGRPDIVAKRLYPNGQNRVLGHFILRTDDDERGMQLIDWGADNSVGVSDVLASLMIKQLRNTTEKRISNLVEQFH